MNNSQKQIREERIKKHNARISKQKRKSPKRKSYGPDIFCSDCKSTNIMKAGYDKYNKQKWNCKNCGHIGPIDSDKYIRYVPDNVFCAICYSSNVRKQGTNSRNKQQWKCLNPLCGHMGPIEDDIIGCHPRTAIDVIMNEYQYEIFTGHMLGDGWTIINGINGSFGIKRSAKDRNYLEWSRLIFHSIHPGPISPNKYKESFIKEKNKFGKIIKRKLCRWSCAFKSLVTKQLTYEHKRWHDKDGKKIIPKDLILTSLSLAIWYLDDGCISVGVADGSNNIILCTNNFTKEEVYNLSNILKKTFDFDFTIVSAKKHSDPDRGYILTMYGKENVLKFAKIVDPYILPEMNMSENRTSGVNKTPWRDLDVMAYLKNEIKLKELNKRLSIKNIINTIINYKEIKLLAA